MVVVSLYFGLNMWPINIIVVNVGFGNVYINKTNITTAPTTARIILMVDFIYLFIFIW